MSEWDAPDQTIEGAPSPKQVLRMRVSELDLSARAINYLENDGIVCVGDLIQKTEDEILHLPSFGRASLRAIKEVLARMGLRLGMEVPGWDGITDHSE